MTTDYELKINITSEASTDGYDWVTGIYQHAIANYPAFRQALLAEVPIYSTGFMFKL